MCVCVTVESAIQCVYPLESDMNGHCIYTSVPVFNQSIHGVSSGPSRHQSAALFPLPGSERDDADISAPHFTPALRRDPAVGHTNRFS